MDEIDPTWLTLLTRDRENGRWRNAAVMSVAAFAAARKAKLWYDAHKTETAYTVTVDEHDDAYSLVQRWIIDQLPSSKQLSLRASTSREYNDDFRSRGKTLHLFYDGSRQQTVYIEGHEVRVHVEDAEHQTGGNARPIGRRGHLQLTCFSPIARDAVIRLIRELLDEHSRRTKATHDVYIASKWGAWETLGDIAPRPLESVILAGDLKQSLVDDLTNFLAQEQTYVRFGIPWHRGYLLHGPPGTGKTSIAQALAGHFGIDVYYIPLSDLDSDTDLAGLLAKIDARSMLLLEDVDVAHATRTRDDQGRRGISLSGLLNALDGVITPHGLLTVMTTNNLAVLDSALVRPGRADRVEKIDYANGPQLEELVRLLLGTDVTLPEPPHGVTPAAVVEVIKPFLGADDPTPAVRAVEELLLDTMKADR